ncbi:MAG: hypothetical protein JW984_11770 [Deltaproteobacteria bacterium]|uniref:Uncharacterized protein n=1 Tax=Candidatus Zymogenus saltonus TaxID=2844893 RepID=A0A9D8KEV6_9DELT|nr:hypothetical protein [Candidatus Zymogenus saltonus]
MGSSGRVGWAGRVASRDRENRESGAGPERRRWGNRGLGIMGEIGGTGITGVWG